MKKTLLISGVLLALTASVASAGGVNLSWTDCGVAGAADATFLCNTNSGAPFTLVASFQPNADGNTVSNEWVVDLEAAGADLPPWWSFKGAGRCRDVSMTQNTNYTLGPFTCLDPWAGAVGLQGFSYNLAFSGPNTARIVGFQSLPASAPSPLAAADEYYSVTLVINRAKTVGTGFCDRCLEDVCIVLNEITVIAGDGSQYKISNPKDRNFATWQGGTVSNPGCPLATPTNKSSWGQVKSLYR